MSSRAWYAACAALAVLCGLAGTLGMRDVPLDSHEIFVAQTTREMSLRGDWVVPYFNQQPRLNKPPLSYWLTGAIAWLAGDLPRVAAWHVRLVSVLAGLAILAFTLMTAALAFDRTTALAAGGVLVSSAGLFSFMHDARPDLLYACWTSAMLAGAAWSVFRPAARGRALAGGIGLLWVSFALATLTKGPHIPALALLGIAVAVRRQHGHWRAVAEALRPMAGMLIVAALCLPWWWMLDTRLDAVQIEKTQLGGTLLAPALSRLGDPYYFYRPLQLMLPWLPLALVAAWLLLRRRSAAPVGFVLYPLLAVCVGLSLGRQYRFFYLLPLIGFLAMAIAIPVVEAIRARILSRGAAITLVVVQAVLVVACAGWVLDHAGETFPGVIAWLAAGTLAAALICWRAAVDWTLRALAALMVWMSFIWPAAALTGALWNAERYGAYELARRASDSLGMHTPLAALDVSATVFVYYSERPVSEVTEPAALAAQIDASADGSLGLVTRAARLAALSDLYAIEILGRYRRGDDDDVLLRLRAKAR